MLALRRDVNESITIDTPDGVITVTILKFTTRSQDGDLLSSPHVTLGIDAPKQYAIKRDDMKRGKP